MTPWLHDRASARLSADRAELRRLLELAAIRWVADRGLSDQELARVRRLADATMRVAGSGDVAGYERADMLFHQALLELTGDPALSEIARLVLVSGRLAASPGGLSNDRVVSEAREHRELVVLLADGMVGAADRLLRLHLSRRSPGESAAGRPVVLEPSCLAGA
jgi:DNA-binding GntR family transcriptional regulator